MLNLRPLARLSVLTKASQPSIAADVAEPATEGPGEGVGERPGVGESATEGADGDGLAFWVSVFPLLPLFLGRGGGELAGADAGRWFVFRGAAVRLSGWGLIGGAAGAVVITGVSIQVSTMANSRGRGEGASLRRSTLAKRRNALATLSESVFEASAATSAVTSAGRSSDSPCAPLVHHHCPEQFQSLAVKLAQVGPFPRGPVERSSAEAELPASRHCTISKAWPVSPMPRSSRTPSRVTGEP